MKPPAIAAWSRRYVQTFFSAGLSHMPRKRAAYEAAQAARPAALAALRALAGRRDHGLDVDAWQGDPPAYTLLAWACSHDPELAMALLGAGATPDRCHVVLLDPRERFSPTPLAIARRHGHDALAAALVKMGAREDEFGAAGPVVPASIYVTREAWIAVPMQGGVGLLRESGPLSVVPRTAPAEAVVDAVRAALDRFVAAEARTPSDAGHRALKARVGARSERALTQVARLVWVESDGRTWRLRGSEVHAGGYDARAGFFDVPTTSAPEEVVALLSLLSSRDDVP